MAEMTTIRAPSMEEAMQQAGLPVPPSLPPGKLVRFRTAGSSRSGWAKRFADGRGGVFGDWITDERYLWLSDTGEPLDEAGRALIRQQAELARQRYEREQRRRQAQAARTAADIWAQAEPVSDHPYLRAKGIEPGWHLGPVRMYRGQLVIPALALSGANTGEIVSLQFVAPNGSKRFLSGGRIQGAGWLMHIRDCDGEIFICEGWATAVTLGNVFFSGAQVVAAFNAGNLVDVALAVRAQCPKARLTIAADNDHRTRGNPGLTKAREAATATGARIFYPDTAALRTGTDFNDLYLTQREGAKP